MSRRLPILYFYVALFAFLGANRFTAKEVHAGSATLRTGNSQHRLPRKHRSPSKYTECRYAKNEVTPHVGPAVYPPAYTEVPPCRAYTQMIPCTRLPRKPALAGKRFLALRMILI